jgi:aminoglycoside 3-N-acetyltransferase
LIHKTKIIRVDNLVNTSGIISRLAKQLHYLGLERGDVVMVHSSFKSLGIKDPEEIILALLETLGETGTLLMPALSYLQKPPNIHDTNLTPSCVGFLSEYFRCRPGTQRSIHPTHSVCGVGRLAREWLDDHIQDYTPCGPHSPFNKLLHHQGKILMIGCGLKPNTTMHAIEEYIQPAYLFGNTQTYTITDSQRRTFEKVYITHNFDEGRVVQRYDRVEGILNQAALSSGILGNAKTYLIQAEALYQAALVHMGSDPCYFIEKGSETTQ